MSPPIQPIKPISAPKHPGAQPYRQQPPPDPFSTVLQKTMEKPPQPPQHLQKPKQAGARPIKLKPEQLNIPQTICECIINCNTCVYTGKNADQVTINPMGPDDIKIVFGSSHPVSQQFKKSNLPHYRFTCVINGVAYNASPSSDGSIQFIIPKPQANYFVTKDACAGKPSFKTKALPDPNSPGQVLHCTVVINPPNKPLNQSIPRSLQLQQPGKFLDRYA